MLVITYKLAVMSDIFLPDRDVIRILSNIYSFQLKYFRKNLHLKRLIKFSIRLCSDLRYSAPITAQYCKSLKQRENFPLDRWSSSVVAILSSTIATNCQSSQVKGIQDFTHDCITSGPSNKKNQNIKHFFWRTLFQKFLKNI